MSTHKYVRNSFAFLFTLTIAGAAFARRPPALERAQAESDRVVASCASVPAVAGDGYRDSLVRFESARSIDPGATRVASCDGDQVQTGSGYRDMLERTRESSSEIQVARR
jgi:hypothetical protein